MDPEHSPAKYLLDLLQRHIKWMLTAVGTSNSDYTKFCLQCFGSVCWNQ